MCESVYAQIPLMQTDEEEWRPVAGFEETYEVSNRGRVRRIAPGRTTYAGRIYPLRLDDKGYPRVRLSEDNRRVLKKVHALVCEAFNGPRPSGYVCNHIDGIKTHNFPSNLEWITRAGNVHHAQRMGLLVGAKGERNSHAVVTADDVREIRRRYAVGDVFQRELAREYGLKQATVSDIVYRQRWKHIE